MKSFRIMRDVYTGDRRVSTFAGYQIAVDIEDAILNALNQWGWGYYWGHDIPGPIPATYSSSGEWYSGLRF